MRGSETVRGEVRGQTLRRGLVRSDHVAMRAPLGACPCCDRLTVDAAMSDVTGPPNRNTLTRVEDAAELDVAYRRKVTSNPRAQLDTKCITGPAVPLTARLIYDAEDPVSWRLSEMRFSYQDGIGARNEGGESFSWTFFFLTVFVHQTEITPTPTVAVGDVFVLLGSQLRSSGSCATHPDTQEIPEERPWSMKECPQCR